MMALRERVRHWLLGDEVIHELVALRDLLKKARLKFEDIHDGDMNNHIICDLCWSVRHPGRNAMRLKGETVKPCCWCLKPTTSGIWLRENKDDESRLQCR